MTRMSVRQTAEIVGLPPATVHRFRTGQDVHLSTAVKMLPVLGVCPCCGRQTTNAINWRDDPDAIVEDDEPQIGRDYA